MKNNFQDRNNINYLKLKQTKIINGKFNNNKLETLFYWN